MSKDRYKFEIKSNVVTSMYEFDDGHWEYKKLEDNKVASYDPLTFKVTIVESKGSYKEVKVYVRDSDYYAFESKTYTDVNGVPILSQQNDDHKDNSKNDRYDDDDLDHDGFEDDVLLGKNSDDRIYGKDGDDFLDGESGNDYLDGGLGDDILRGGSGKDKLHGGLGDDDLSGGDGKDKLYGEDGDDDVTGGAGDDFVYGGKGDDYLYAGTGNDSVDGGIGDDLIVGGDGPGNDQYKGGAGSDTVSYTGALSGITVNLLKGSASSSDNGNSAEIGTDKLNNIENVIGGNHDDTLIGNALANKVNGGDGDDLIIGGMGNDLLIGGFGDDTFKFSKVSEIGLQKHDVIADFQKHFVTDDFVSGDLIDLSAIDATKGLGKNDAFQWIDNSAYVTRDNANGALWFKNGVLYGSTDKDVEAEFQIELTGVTSLNVHEIVL